MRMRKKAWARPELEACPFFVQKPEENRGKWKTLFKDSSKPLWIELGCGKSPFLAKMIHLHPEINFIGIDLSPDVLGVARRNIVNSCGEGTAEPDNILLTAYNIERISSVFDENDSAQRIYISFCNPWPKGKHNKRRLTYPTFLKNYKSFLISGGEIWFKTDDDNLFADSLSYFSESGFETVCTSYDLHAQSDWPENVMTEHEVMFSEKGIKIKAAIFRLP